jgi:putative transposase
MAAEDDDRRGALIARIQRLPRAELVGVERYLARVEKRLTVDRSTRRTSTSQTNHWPHAPVHRLSGARTYLVTAGTLRKQHFFRESRRLDLLQTQLLSLAKDYCWQLEAWAVFSNHYHFVGHREESSGDLADFLGHLHSVTASEINGWDARGGRQVWHNFWETKLTFERSYLARLAYVHQNAVKHGLVRLASEYPWCSAGWFERTATPAQVRTLYGFKTDKIKVLDDFGELVW